MITRDSKDKNDTPIYGTNFQNVVKKDKGKNNLLKEAKGRKTRTPSSFLNKMFKKK